MNTTTTKLIAMITIITVGFAASTASADNKNNNKGNNNKKSGGFSISFGGGSSNSWHNFNNSNHNKNYHVKKVYVQPSYIYEKCFYPLHRLCFVLPGDTWYTISQREYGNVNLCHYVASYNGLFMNSQLFVGQHIRLPEIHPHGVLRASSAPMPVPFIPAVAPIVTQNFVAPAMSATPISPVISQNFAGPVANATQSTPLAGVGQATESASIPSLAIGSVIMLDGQTLGSDQGIVRLRLAQMSLPVEVLEWTSTSAKVRLPQMELTGAMRAELEVLRADGSLASKLAVQLTLAGQSLAAASTTQVAQGN